jgi:hypothetical protein
MGLRDMFQRVSQSPTNPHVPAAPRTFDVADLYRRPLVAADDHTESEAAPLDEKLRPRTSSALNASRTFASRSAHGSACASRSSMNTTAFRRARRARASRRMFGRKKSCPARSSSRKKKSIGHRPTFARCLFHPKPVAGWNSSRVFEFFEGAAEQFEYKTKDTARLAGGLELAHGARHRSRQIERLGVPAGQREVPRRSCRLAANSVRSVMRRMRSLESRCGRSGRRADYRVSPWARRGDSSRGARATRQDRTADRRVVERPQAVGRLRVYGIPIWTEMSLRIS